MIIDASIAAPVGQRWWVSWYSAGSFEYHGPWWITGQELGGRQRRTIVAAVIADSAEAAKRVIYDAHDEPRPVIEWRFCEPRAGDWVPFCDRFERSPWMRWPK